MSSMETVREISDIDKRKIERLKLLLTEQEEKFENEEKGVEREKEATKGKVTAAFENVREVLAGKERELLDKIDAEYSVAINFLACFVNSIKIEKQKVSELLTDSRDSANDGGDLHIEQLKNDIDTKSTLRNDKLNQFHVPNLILNERSIETVKDLHFAEFRESASRSTNQTESLITVNENGESVADENVPETVNSETDDSGCPEAAGNTGNQCHEVESEILGATGISGQVSTPSAPPFDSEESPPPYWQVVGLPGPQEEVQDQNCRLPENKLEYLYSFPVPKKGDRHRPMPVALTWNCGRVCIVDKANERVEFFFPNGEYIVEMVLVGTGLRDVTFLDEGYNGKIRYVVTSPKNKILLIICISSCGIPDLIRKIVLPQQYVCICRGPTAQTLVGAEVSMTTSSPSVVNIFTLTGHILQSISHTPSFGLWQYIKSVEVFGSSIIILDWKLNLVAVYRDDSSAVGEYKGTEHSPLINPSDMTLDREGNVLILNGEFQNIHVIDLQCHPLEVIEIPRDISPSPSRLKLIAFDLESQKLCIAKSNGEVAVYTFENGYDCLPQGKFLQRLLLPHQNATKKEQRAPEVLPLVEGMLPSTVETIVNRQLARNQNRQYHS